jgi:hypothetical protein
VPALTSLRSWQRSAGQAVGQEASGSQVSFASLTPLPHTIRQSLSSLPLQPAGQQPSFDLHIDSWPDSTHMALHSAALP